MGLLALFLQGSSGGHMLLVEHRQCAEHGELVHGSDAHAHGPNAPTAARQWASLVTDEADAHDAHDHCLVCADRRAVAANGAASSVIDIARRDEAPGPPTFHDFAGPTRHRIAPKNSPPA